MREIAVEIMFENSKKEDAEIAFVQSFGNQYQLLAESLAGKEKNSRTREWDFTLKPGEKQILTFKIRVTNQ